MAGDLFEALPPLYAGWVGELLGAGIPAERKATCDACAMCPPPGGATGGAAYFEPSLKCCTFMPRLPNFLVGAILADDADAADAAGRESLLRRLGAREAVTPLGVDRSAAYGLLYDAGEETFGKARGLVCPHFLADTGRCGVWRHRNSVCATWFCKHERGQVGFQFWRSALQRLLGVVERALAKWCVAELDIGPDALEALAASPAWNNDSAPLTARALDGGVDERAYARLWGRWRDREPEFFARSAALVAPLSWAEVSAIAGAEGGMLATVTQLAFQRLTAAAAPGRLVPAEFRIARAGPEATRVVAYSPYDPLDIPNVVLALLPAFDGRPTADVIADVEARTGFRLEPDLVRKLADFGVLKPAEGEA
ncbi:MAG TPA: hypothetical protein VMT68_00520 [Caulobacteraceae bacterium]|nr:hypothetical protein [Caulobacteraceae bacterium]